MNREKIMTNVGNVLLPVLGGKWLGKLGRNIDEKNNELVKLNIGSKGEYVIVHKDDVKCEPKKQK